MSLSALNYPPLVASAGAALGLGLPAMERVISTSPWAVVRLATLASFGLNFIAVSRPGRLDGEAAAEDGKLSPRNGRTLVAPAGWAFAIWGPIFLGEFIHVTAQLFVPETSAMVPLLKKMAGPFIGAQLFQTLWCAAFRPKYKGYLMYISSAFLGATAYSLSKAHTIFTKDFDGSYSAVTYGIHLLPIALHFGWITAASLVNLNGAFAMMEKSTSKMIALIGHASIVGATALGTYMTLTKSAPVYGGVISWALLAVADSMKQRLEAAEQEQAAKKKDKKGNPPGLYGAKTQLTLSRVGAFVCTGASVLATGSKFFLPKISGNGGNSIVSP